MESAGNLDRSKYLGGSDVAAVLACSPFEGQTPLDCYFRKVGRPEGEAEPAPDPAQEKRFRRGRRMEPIVIEMLRDELPIDIVKISTKADPNRYVDEDHAFLAAEIDYEWRVNKEMKKRFAAFERLPLGSIQNGEVKTTMPFAADVWGEEGTDSIPLYYAAQAWHGLGVTGRQATLFGLLVGSDDLRTYPVMADPKLIDPIRGELVKFWTEHVLKKIPPQPRTLANVERLLSLRETITLKADEATLLAVAKYNQLKDDEKRIKGEIKKAQYELGRKLLGDQLLPDGKPSENAKDAKHVIVNGIKPILSIALEGRDLVDAEKLGEKYPEIKAECLTHSSYYVFRRPRGKKAK